MGKARHLEVIVKRRFRQLRARAAHKCLQQAPFVTASCAKGGYRSASHIEQHAENALPPHRFDASRLRNCGSSFSPASLGHRLLRQGKVRESSEGIAIIARTLAFVECQKNQERFSVRRNSSRQRLRPERSGRCILLQREHPGGVLYTCRAFHLHMKRERPGESAAAAQRQAQKHAPNICRPPAPQTDSKRERNASEGNRRASAGTRGNAARGKVGQSR